MYTLSGILTNETELEIATTKKRVISVFNIKTRSNTKIHRLLNYIYNRAYQFWLTLRFFKVAVK